MSDRLSDNGRLILICGSRDWPANGYDAVEEKLNDHLLPTDRVLTGGARGIDTFAHRFAVGLGLESTVMPANWNTHGRSAGPIRNIAMLDKQPQLVIAFVTDNSKGTRHTIQEAWKRKIETIAYTPRIIEALDAT